MNANQQAVCLRSGCYASVAANGFLCAAHYQQVEDVKAQAASAAEPERCRHGAAPASCQTCEVAKRVVARAQPPARWTPARLDGDIPDAAPRAGLRFQVRQ